MKALKSTGILLFLVLFSFADRAEALSYSVDGVLDEYGISQSMLEDKTQGFGTEANYIPVNYSRYFNNTSSGYLNPGYGGQAFDTEGIGGATYGDYLYLYLITGFDVTSPDGVAGYMGGDLAIDTDNNGTYDFGLDIYTGDLIAASSWSDPYYTSSTPFQAVGTVIQNGVDLAIQGVRTDAIYDAPISFDRWILETRISLASLGIDPTIASDIMLHWTMGCGNDMVEGSVEHTPVPEPTTMLLFGTGLIGLAQAIKRKRA